MRLTEEQKGFLKELKENKSLFGGRDLTNKITANHIKMLKEIERLQKENNDLRKLYQRTYKHLFEIGNDELARYFQAQIDECSTFYVEPIIDYYEETKRLNSIIKEVRELLNQEWYSVLRKETITKVKELLDKVEKVGETDDSTRNV